MNGRTAKRSSGRRRFLLLLLPPLTATPLQAQVVRDTARADTLAADTLVAPRDTTPPPVMVRWPAFRQTGLPSGVRVWDRDALLAEGAVTLLDLLARVPGITPLRTGVFLQPESATTFGSGGARTVVELDGWVVDPLLGPSADLSAIQLVHLDEVRVERRADVLLIRLRSSAPENAAPYSRIEASIGEPNANVFRGVLLVPRFLVGPVGLGVERVEVQGSGFPQPADVFGAWVRWGWLSERRGIELVFHQDRIHRGPGSPIPLDVDRRDAIVRARQALGDRVVSEAYFGTSRAEASDLQAGVDDSLRFRATQSARQAGVRLAGDLPVAGGELAMRWRDAVGLPRLELMASARLRAGDRAMLAADITQQRWRDGPQATGWRAHAELSPFAGVRAFAELAAGGRGTARSLEDTVPPVIGERTAWRAGGELQWRGASAGGALLYVRTDSIALLGLPGETMAAVLPGGSVTGWEAWGRLPLLRNWIAATGSWSTWSRGTLWSYLPASQLQAALELHALPLASGNLELFGRFEAARRGSMLAPAPLATELVEVPARILLNGYFQIRIIDVRIFIRFDDLAGQEVQDLPGFPIRGPRVLYGVKWTFWN